MFGLPEISKSHTHTIGARRLSALHLTRWMRMEYEKETPSWVLPLIFMFKRFKLLHASIVLHSVGTLKIDKNPSATADLYAKNYCMFREIPGQDNNTLRGFLPDLR
ncbi:hypothetical protein PV325_007795 [Microctonus aethiopoides]|nr:hypothetical protein PV325_007795 [Microctonus aethiopoides]